MLRVKVLVDGRAIGWLRSFVNGKDETEVLVSPSSARANKFDEQNPGDRQAMAWYMAQFVGPERATAKSREPAVSFQLVRI